jgi:hypothetical protein
LVTTLLAWPAGVRPAALAGLVETAKQLKAGGIGDPATIRNHKVAG